MRFRELLNENRDPLISALVTDTGGAISVAELEGVRAGLERWSKLGQEMMTPPPPRPSARKGYTIHSSYRPYELVGVLAPWNAPLILLFIDAVPALMAGSTVLLKPSEITPRFAEPLKAIVDKLDEPLRDAIQIVVGGAVTGAAVVNEADLICFTGGLKVGRIVSKRCAERLIPVFLELGGKDPVIVDASADLETASSSVVWAALLNTGQNCFSVERVYVHQDVHEEFLRLVVDKAADVARRGIMQPMISKGQAEIIRTQLDDASQKGAKTHLGGKVVINGNGGTCVEVTVVSDVNHDMTLMTEETFGPIIPIMMFRNIEEAIDLANDSVYGLSGAVFALPKEVAMEIGSVLNVGLLGINEAGTTAIVNDAEKTSFGLSGVTNSSRMGKSSIKRFVRSCAQVVKEDPTAAHPNWFNPVSIETGHKT